MIMSSAEKSAKWRREHPGYQSEWNRLNRDKRTGYDRKWKSENAEKSRASARARYKLNPKRSLAATRKWREKNPDRLKIYELNRDKNYLHLKCKKYRESNLPSLLAKEAEHRRLHKTERAAQYKSWCKRNPDKVRAHRRRRDSRILESTPKWADESKINIFYERAVELGLTVDHVVPIKHPLVCGLHVETNMQLLTRSANSKKNNHFKPYGISFCRNDLARLTTFLKDPTGSAQEKLNNAGMTVGKPK